MARKGIFFPLKDAALRDDVHTLGGLVGEVLQDQGGPALFDAVEGDRQAAIGRRQGEAEDTIELVVRTRGRPAPEAREVIRAFGAWFQVVNMAEKVHRVRRRRQYMHDSSTPQPGGLDDCFLKLRSRGLSLDQVLALLGQVSIEPVFTAHPTESTRRTLLRQQQRVSRLLLGRLDPSLTPPEQRAIVERVRTELTTAWQTADNSRERLTVADEREHVLFFLVEVIYEVIPAFYEELESALGSVYGPAALDARVPEILRFGSWVGGDMDGHPDVHAKTIRESCARHHQLVVNRYYAEAQALGEKLSQSASRVGVAAAVTDRIEQYRTLVPGAKATPPASHDRMPYRVLVGQIAERLRATYDHSSGQYERVEQLIDDLELIGRSLIENRGRTAGLFYVRRMLRRVRTFGFHLATLDVRQNADVHRQIVGQGLAEPDWTARSAAERTARLNEALASDESPTAILDSAGKRALWVYEAMEYCSHRYGSRAIGTYVVSMAADVDDLLSVLLMARWAGYTDTKTGQVPLDVAPLFESVEALERSGDIISRLLSNPAYRAHLAARGDQQVVMIGYSDSNKESGIVSSRWLLRRAQEAMTAACAAAGVRLLVFHGRGGSISRGGSRTEAIVRSLPAGVVGGRLRVTEQGESINDRYGLRPIALRTFEQGVNTLTLLAAGYYGVEHLESRWLEAMDLLARASRERYRAVVHDDPAFLDFFLAVTPVDVIERMQIGSRPVSRQSGAGVDALRPVPWMFAWSQSRHMVPGWFGAGAGLAAVRDRFGAEILSEMYGRWPFFEGLMDDVEIRMARADLGIAAQYEDLAPPILQCIATTIRDEYQLAAEQVQALKGCARLLDSEPTLQRSIRLRNPYVDPIHLTQVDLLRRWRETNRDDRELFEALLASVNGIAQGLQGTV
jgi:phosphoenolpyruvate carboxylase